MQTEKEIAIALAQVFKQDPRLRPDPDKHDYQLTYPPAIQIETPDHQGIPSADDYQQYALGNLKSKALYFHFGFCRYRCRYCHHYEIRPGEKKSDLMTRYVKAMCTEMHQMKDKFAKLKSLAYFMGGGTPTAIPTELLDYFLLQLDDTFGPPPTAMSTVEVKPITATDEKLSLLSQAGFSRINLGVQTMDPALYAFHHHKESLSVVFDAIERARTAGFKYINLDIMTGLENQTPDSWQTTLSSLKQLAQSGAIDSVFIYPYHDDPRSKTFAKTSSLPGLAETAHSEASAREMFTELGWGELGTRFFRSPRHVRRELIDLARKRANPSYGEILYHGFGNSSFSVGDSAAYLNRRDALGYCEQIESGQPGISHWLTLDNHQRATRDLTFDILYSPIVRVRSISKKYGTQTMSNHVKQLEQWTEMGLGRWSGLWGTWRLTPLGKLVHQQMIAALYLPVDRRHFDVVMEQRLIAGRGYRGY